MHFVEREWSEEVQCYAFVMAIKHQKRVKRSSWLCGGAFVSLASIAKGHIQGLQFSRMFG